MTHASNLKDTAANRTRRQRAVAAILEALDDAHQPGFYGTATVEVTLNDGTIQHIRRRLERLDRL